MDAHAPILDARIIRRVVVIDNEASVREAVIYESDTFRDAKRKLRRIGL